jgi:3,2-trans-enoyl-CoA isomerase
MQTLNIEYKENYAIVQMDHGKVNAISTELTNDLHAAFTDLEKNEAVKGVILIGRPHCFSAGLDIGSMIGNGIEGGRAFWKSYLTAIQTMVRFPKPFICGMTGYAPAGGTTLALCADYRIMGKGEKHITGMNEFKNSMVIPELLADIYAYHLGEKEAWEAVQNVKMYDSDAAVEAGLANESVEVEEVVPLAEKRMQQRLRVPSSVYAQTKRYLRKGLLKLVDRDMDEMLEVIVEDLKSPHTQKIAAMFMASLKRK